MFTLKSYSSFYNTYVGLTGYSLNRKGMDEWMLELSDLGM